MLNLQILTFFKLYELVDLLGVESWQYFIFLLLCFALDIKTHLVWLEFINF